MLLVDAIRSHAKTIDLPSGGRGDVIDIASIAKIAQKNGIAGHIVEAEALGLDIYPTRYLRNHQSINPAQQKKLLESTIVQVGLGGLGGSLLDIFLRTGVGTIRCADGDSFEESNLNRQALSTPANTGLPKAEAAHLRGRELNPSISLDARNEFLTSETLPGFVQGADVIIDALGGLETRPALQAAAANADAPLVTGALAGWTGYVSVVHPGQPGPADIMGTDNGAEEQLGCPAPAVTLFASLIACEAIRLLINDRLKPSPSMLIIDLQSMTFERVQL